MASARATAAGQRRRRPGPRADARANIDKILDAAVRCLARDPNASVSEIAREAGVGRVTLYGHFPSREVLVETALARVIEAGDATLSSLDLSGEPRAALRALIESSWLLMAQAGAVLEAAQASLPPSRIQELHAKPAARLEELIQRGQAEGAFRTDLPAEWLVSALHHLMKGAASDVASGRLVRDQAAGYIAATMLAVVSPARADAGSD